MTVQTAPIPVQGRTTIWDNSSPLGLRITSGGAKTFVVILGRRRHTIGRYGRDGITLSQARTAAKQLKAELVLGRLLPSSRGVCEAADEYLKSITIRPNTHRAYHRDLKRLPDIRLTEVAPHHLNAILDPLPVAARRQALKTYVTFFNWAIRRHYLDQSPTKRFRVEKPAARSRTLSDDELRKVWFAPEAIGGSFGKIVQCLMLTGLRRQECASILSSWISFTALQSASSSQGSQCSLVIPSAITKNKKELCLPLGNLSAAIISSAISETQSPLLFATHGTTPFSAWNDAVQQLREAVGFSDFSLHTLRHTYRSNLAKLGVAPHIAERLVNHISAQSEMSRIYDHFTYWPDLCAAVQKHDEWFRTNILHQRT
jgi:integrase